MLSGKSIDWELIANQYDQMIKYATALRPGTAEAQPNRDGRNSPTPTGVVCQPCSGAI